MTLSSLIRKRDTGGIATAIPAISATQLNEEAATVARIATVAVANPKEGQTAAAELPKPDPFPDDRRTCDQCLNLRKRVCSIGKPERGALVVANRGYRPAPDMLQRCAGYLPNAADTDQRPGRERWPALMQKGGE